MLRLARIRRAEQVRIKEEADAVIKRCDLIIEALDGKQGPDEPTIVSLVLQAAKDFTARHKDGSCRSVVFNYDNLRTEAKSMPDGPLKDRFMGGVYAAVAQLLKKGELERQPGGFSIK